MEPCNEPEEPGEVLALMRQGKVDDAATAYVRYVFEVRDSFQLCNGRLAALRNWWPEGDINEP